jgi:hypothetical protein
LSVAVVLMAGWLAITIILSRYTTTSAVGDTEMTTAPAQALNGSPVTDEPRVTVRANSVYFEPMARDDASATLTPPRSALALAPFAEPPPAGARLAGSALLSTAMAGPDVTYRSIPAPLPYPPPRATEGTVGATTSIAATVAIADLLRPPPYPSRHAGEGSVAASVPVPRPRPRLEGEDVPFHRNPL